MEPGDRARVEAEAVFALGIAAVRTAAGDDDAEDNDEPGNRDDPPREIAQFAANEHHDGVIAGVT